MAIRSSQRPTRSPGDIDAISRILRGNNVDARALRVALGGALLDSSVLRLIEDCLPRQQGNVSLSNLQVLNGILYVAEQGCKCVYEVMSEMDGFDTDAVLATMEDYVKSGGVSTDEKFADLLAAMAKKNEIMDRVDAAECMKPIEDGIFEKGLEYEDVQQAFARHCRLSAFFRF